MRNLALTGAALLLAMVVLALVACGDSDESEPSGQQGSGDKPAAQDKGSSQAKEEKPDPDDPYVQAEKYAKDKFPEATSTDDFLAAAVSGCYVGITGEYLGGPESWSPEKAAKIEYPEPDLRAILDQARKDCAK
ncbi:MAG: hypothetical protein ABI726_05065 [bacterium]